MKAFLKTPIGTLKITSDEMGKSLLSIQKVDRLPKNTKQSQEFSLLKKLLNN